MKKKNSQKKLLKILFASLLSFLTSCGTVPDKPVCVDVNPSKGFCVWTISNKEMEVDDEHLLDGKTWYDLNLTMIKVPVDTWKALKKYIITQCKKNNNCSEGIDSWDRSMSTLEQKISN